MTNMTIAELKRIISDLPDNMPIIIPDDSVRIFGFCFVRVASILSSDVEKYRTALCLNTAIDEDITDQSYFSGRNANVEKILFGPSELTRERRIK